MQRQAYLFMNIYLQRVKHYCIIILKGRIFKKYLPTAITCENFIHVADLLCRKKTQTLSPARFLFNSGHKTKEKSGKEVSQCLKIEKVHGHFDAAESTWLGTKKGTASTWTQWAKEHSRLREGEFENRSLYHPAEINWGLFIQQQHTKHSCIMKKVIPL